MSKDYLGLGSGFEGTFVYYVGFYDGSIDVLIVFKNGPFPASFSFIFVFSIHS